MCEGTRCTHHIDPSVLFLEEPYDSWEYTVEDITYEGEASAYVTRVMHSTRIHRSALHEQPMIMLKDDARAFVGRESDAQMTEYLYCDYCEGKYGSHRCYECNASINHSAMGICPDCWWKPVPEVYGDAAVQQLRMTLERIVR